MRTGTIQVRCLCGHIHEIQGIALGDPDEGMRKKIENQRQRIVYLEGATNHASGTPLTLAEREASRLASQVSDRDWTIGDLKRQVTEYCRRAVIAERKLDDLRSDVLSEFQARLVVKRKLSETSARLAASLAVRRELVRERDEAKLKHAIGSFNHGLAGAAANYGAGFVAGVKFSEEGNEFFGKDGEVFS